MCRIAAYTGPEIPLENIVIRPAHSLLSQSQNATEAKLAVNGDGFGISWYGDHERPGLYRDVLPAWADDNLTNLCRMVRSRLFIAHVRASTMGETSRSNCHPFTYGNWSFCHNGQIPHFKAIRRRLEAELPDDLFNAKQGTTDSEMTFLTLLKNGLDKYPNTAMQATLDTVGAAQADGPVKMTCVFTNGRALYAFRFGSNGIAPTLYASEILDNDGRALASEPLCGQVNRWTGLPQNVLCRLTVAGLKIDERNACSMAFA